MQLLTVAESAGFTKALVCGILLLQFFYGVCTAFKPLAVTAVIGIGTAAHAHIYTVAAFGGLFFAVYHTGRLYNEYACGKQQQE